MAAGADTISSAADLISSVDLSGTIFDPGTDGGGDADLGTPGNVDGASEGEEPIEAEGTESADEGIVPAESEGEVPEEEAAETGDEDQPAPAAEAQPADGQMDGVREVTINGKKALQVTPERWDRVYNNGYKVLRDFEAVAGEPMTPEALDVRQRAYMGQERLYSDLLSGEPGSVAKVIEHFMDEGARAQQDGEVGADPVVPMATTFYDTLRAKSPDGYAHLRMKAAGDLVTEMYAESQRTGDKNLAISASHIAKAVGMPYKKDAEITEFLANRAVQSDPMATLRAENQRLQGELSGRQTQDATAQFNSWKGATTQAVTSAVLADAVLPSLSTERKAWEQFPSQFENLVVTPLNKAVKQTIGQDKNFNARIQLLDQNAKRAPSAQVRANIAEQIKNAYIQRARLAVDAHKKGILESAAALLKQGSDATHQRRQAAQQQRGPRGAQAPAPKSLIPERNAGDTPEVFDPKAEVARMRRLFA